MPEQQESKPHQQQVYDSTLKSLLQDQPGEMLSFFLGDVEYLQPLDGEAIRPTTLRTDRCFLVKATDMEEIVHLELETAADSEILCRMLEYYAILYRKYKKTIIPVVVYPFETTLPESTLSITDKNGEILTFHVRIIALSQYKAQEYLNQHKVSIYALLPTMQGANYDILSQALDEMKVFYREQPNRFANHLLWFGVFLRRTTIVSSLDKERILNKMTDFESLLDENPFVQKRTLEAEERGEVRGEIKGTQKTLLAVVKGRFPALVNLAQEQVPKINKPEYLDILVEVVSSTSDEVVVRTLLNSLAA